MRTIAKTFGTAMMLAATLALWAPQASAVSGYYSGGVGSNRACTNCHVANPNTCNGCHAHGTHASSSKTSINVTATTDKASYAPGGTVIVTVNGGYRTGWVRVNLYDQNMVQLARSSCPGGVGGCPTSVLPATLTATAPTAPGTYTWRASWYGNAYDTGFTSAACTGTGSALTPPCFRQDPNNSGAGAIHGEEIVAVASFTVTGTAAPVIALNPTSLNFGNVNVNTPTSLTTQVQNTGTATLNVTAIARCTSPATSAEFTLSPSTLAVNAGQSATLTVTYTPTAAGNDTGCIALTSNASNGPTTNLAVSGTGVVPPTPRIAVNPTSLAFGSVIVGATSAAQTFTVSNTGTATLTGTLARAAGTSAEFAFSPATFSITAGGAAVTVTVTYSPTAVGADSGSLVVSSNDATSPTVGVTLSGTGATAPAPVIALAPTSLGFGTVTVGGSASLPTQVQNTGTATLNVTGIARCTSPATSAEFTFSPATLTVNAGQSATLTVTYTPTGAGADTGCIAVTSNASNGPTTNLAVSGTGQLAPAPQIAVSPTSLAFGSVAIGTPSSKTFTISNTGNAALTGTLARAGGTSAEYAFSPATFTVVGGGSQVVTVTYTPADGTTDNGSLVVSSNDTASPTVSVGLSGTGVASPTPAISLSPNSLAFGTATIGSSASLTSAVQNTGTATLNVTAIAPCAGTSGEFTWTSSPTPPFAVSPGAATTVTVTYAPADTGSDSGCLAIASDDPASPTVNLGVSGTGAAPGAPSIALSPAALQFGTVSVGSAVTKTTLVQNAGSATLTVSQVARCNGTSAEFTFSPTTLAVSAGQSATLSVTYAPTDTTTDTGCIALAHDDASQASPLDLAVTGTGASGSTSSGCGCGGSSGGVLGLLALLLIAAGRTRRRQV